MGVHLVHCTSIMLVTSRTTYRLNSLSSTHGCLRVIHTHTHNGGVKVLPRIAAGGRGRLHRTVHRREHIRLNVRFSHFCSLIH